LGRDVIPANNSKVLGRIQIVGTAVNGTLPLTIIQVRIDGGPWQTAVGRENWSFQVDAGKLAGGQHTIEARAFDGSLYSDAASIHINAQRPNPGVPTEPVRADIIILIVCFVSGLGLFVLFRKRLKG